MGVAADLPRGLGIEGRADLVHALVVRVGRQRSQRHLFRARVRVRVRVWIGIGIGIRLRVRVRVRVRVRGSGGHHAAGGRIEDALVAEDLLREI